MLLLSASSASSYFPSSASDTMVGVDMDYCRPWASDEDPTMKSKSKDSIVGDDDKDLEDDPDSDSQSSFHDNESDMESQPEQQQQQQQQQTQPQKQQQQQISSPPPPPPPPPPSQQLQQPPQQRQSPEIDGQVKSKCKILPAHSPSPASPAKESPSREMAPSPLRRSSVITEGSLAQSSSIVALPPTTTSSVSVITRTASHSTHTATPSRQSVRDRYKLINGAYRSFFPESNHCSPNSHSSNKNSSHHVNLHHHLIGSSATTTTTTATTTTTSINNHKSHHSNNTNNNINTTANNNNNNNNNNNLDQPLDLSKKPKAKSQTPPPHIVNGINSSSSGGGLSSSLQSLQQRFGGDFHINGTNIRSHKSIEDQVGMGQMSLGNFGSNQLINRNMTDYGNNVNVDLNAALKGSNNNSLINRGVVKAPSDLSMDGMNSRYTTHRCSCQKVFGSLYDLSLHLQETHHIPAGSKDTNVMEYPKLVRGQDMWLNQESEQTRRILRCMQCGESFKTLPELTLHMMQTQHYTKIVSSDHGRRSHKCSSYCDRDLEKECIFKCKVCQETYSDMEGLANHMIMSGHHKKQILRSYNSPEILLRARRKRPFSSEEKPGLGANPTVATLLEFKRKCVSHDGLNSPSLKYADVVTKEDDGYITCENCGKCIEMRMFVEHVRTCVRQRSGVIDALKMKLNVDDDQRRIKKSEDPSSGTNHVPTSQQSSNSVEYDLSKVKKEPRDYDEKVDVSKGITICSPSKVEPASSEELDSSNQDMKIMPEKMQVCPPDDEDSTSSNVRKDPDRIPLDIINPDNSSSVGGLSALRAMESFIQKSFKNKFDKNCHKESANSASITSVTQELKQIATPDSPTTKYVSNQTKVALKNGSSLQNVPSSKPLLCKESNDECSDPEAEDSFKSAGKELQSLSDMCEQITKQTTTTTVVKMEERSSSSSAENQEETPSSPMSVSDKKPAKEPLEEKYLQLPPTTESDPSKSSALDSLSSFVYGQPMTCEHPLDSLQKLITNTDTIKMPSHSTQPPKCQTVTSSSSPDISIPLNLSTKCQKDDEPEKSGREDLSASNNSTDAAHGDMTSPASDSDSGDYKCPACSRQCASKGSCRYHLSRCHLSSVKKFSIRDPFSMSPFVYLPLDHTAKFTKYYEMAHELANKSNVPHELTAKGK